MLRGFCSYRDLLEKTTPDVKVMMKVDFTLPEIIVYYSAEYQSSYREPILHYLIITTLNFFKI